jgi:DNA repair protein RadD
MTPIELRPYQRTAIEHLYRYWQQKRGRHPLVVVPTGGGKSFIMAALIREVLARWSGTRIVCATHVRELIAQNHAELCGIWPEAPAGIYSAGLGQRDADAQILFCGIQSVHNKAGAIGHASLLLIDEAHLVPRNGNTAYRRFIAELLRINPRLKVVGFTATPFRLGSGRLDEGEDRIFDGVAYEVQVPPLIRQGFLAPLVTKPTAQTLDVSAVGDRNGDFIAGELQNAISEARITEAAMDEVAAYGQSRRSWLLFGSGVEHAGHIADAVRRRGFSCEAVTGETSVRDRVASRPLSRRANSGRWPMPMC